MEFKDKLIHLRNERFSYPILKKEISSALGKVVQLYTKYEKGDNVPSIELIDKLSSFYGISTNYFFESPIGRVTSYTPFFIEYDVVKQRFLYERVHSTQEEVSNYEAFRTVETILHKESDPTDFFLYEINKDMFEENKLIYSMFTYDKSTSIERIGGYYPRIDSESIQIFDYSNLSNYTLMMKKSNIEDVFSQKHETVYMIYDKVNKKVLYCLIYKKEDKVFILPIYDVNENEYIDYHKNNDDVYFMEVFNGDVVDEIEEHSLSLKDIDILAKTLTIYPANHAANIDCLSEPRFSKNTIYSYMDND